MKKRVSYLLLCATLLGQASMTSSVLAIEVNTGSSNELIHKNENTTSEEATDRLPETQNFDEGIQNEVLQRAFNVAYTLTGDGISLTLPVATMKIQKDEVAPVTVRFKSSVGSALLDDKLSQKIKLSEGVTLQSLPSIDASAGMTYTYKYSVDGVKYSSTPPADISQIKYISYSGSSIAYHSFTVDLKLSVDWNKAHSGKNLMAEFFEGSDETQVGQLYYDSYRMVTAIYEDESGETLNPPVQHYGTLGSGYSTENLIIPGYTLIEAPENAEGVYSDEDKVVKYIYTKKSVTGGDVIVKYVDTEGNEISDEVVKSGVIGEGYSTEQKDIDGYTFKEIQGDATGMFTDQAQTVTYVYTKNPVKAADVTTKYVDASGNKISNDEVKTGNVGESYSTEQKIIDGYTFKEVQGSAVGIFADQEQTITYIYTRNNVTPNTKLDDHKDTSKSGKVNDNKTDSISDNKNTLPQTGDNERLSIIGMIFGFLVILGITIKIILKRKRQD